jgi:hypothetical protein
MVEPPPLPAVIKVGWPHAGYGKIRIYEKEDFEGMRSVVAVHTDYVIAEPLIESEYEVRIVFIAPDYYRVHQRRALGWKVNMCSTQVREEMEMTPLYKLWCDEVRNAFGGLDMFAIDGIIAKDGRQYILEVNGSTQGFAPEHAEEYRTHMHNLVIARLRESVIGGPAADPMRGEEIERETEIVNLRNRVEELENDNAVLRAWTGPVVPNKATPKIRIYPATIAVAALLLGLVIGWLAKLLASKYIH